MIVPVVICQLLILWVRDVLIKISGLTFRIIHWIYLVIILEIGVVVFHYFLLFIFVFPNIYVAFQLMINGLL